MTVALIAGALAVLLVAYVFAGGRRGNENPDRLPDQQVAGRSGIDPGSRCRDQQTIEMIKRELFRRAAQAGGSGGAEFDRLYANTALRMDSPRLRSHDEEAGTIACTGALTVDLPPGFDEPGGNGTLTSDIGYSFQRAADGSGDVITLSRAEALVIRMASLGREGSETAESVVPPPVTEQAAASRESGQNIEPQTQVRAAPPGRAPTVASREPNTTIAQRPRVTAGPSFNCRRARTRGEVAVCRDAGLASLDRQMASQFNQSMSRGTAGQRAQLQRTRGRFLARRDSCGTSACMADAYRARMNEIGAITGSATPRAASPEVRRVVTPNSPQPSPVTAGPSFNCRYARTRGEATVCQDAGLAGLDRQMAASFGAAMSRGTPAQRELLQRTRGRFLKYRDSCRSKSCVAASYRSRLTEIGDIMAGRWKVY